ncbi:NAD-dependent epimerase/dehydratase family protein [bacterium]|nr:NAD-dependent epimerase/dehydratase family protein [bacterium]
MSKILITGGAGFIGSSLADKLIERGEEVIIVDNLSSGKKDYIPKEAKFYNLDILDDELENIFKEEKPDYVCHLAAQIDVRISIKDPKLDSDINVKGGINVLVNAHKYGVKKIIFSSTGGAIYGEANIIPTPETYEAKPISPYGINKLTFEHYLRYYKEIFNQDYTCLRFANVYGPKQYKGGEAGVVAIFSQQAVENGILYVNGDGKQTRDYVFVGDVVEAIISALNVDYSGEINISNGKETTLLEVIEALKKENDNFKVEFREGIKGEQRRSCLDNSLAKKVLNWEPKVDIEKGISLTYKWSKDNIKL